jgi:hypothetical protein
MASPNKRLVTTQKARRNFCVIARRKGLGACVGFVLPVRALFGLHNRGVSAPMTHDNFAEKAIDFLGSMRSVDTDVLVEKIDGKYPLMRGKANARSETTAL